MIVADTNLIAYLLIEGDRTEAARAVWARDPVWSVPPLWRSELLNVLATAVRVELLSPDQAHGCWRAATETLRMEEVEPRGLEVLRTAMDRRISAYDAHFVVVAERLGVPLVTGDRRLVRGYPEGAVLIEDFAATSLR